MTANLTALNDGSKFMQLAIISVTKKRHARGTRMKTIWLVKVTTEIGEEAYYVGAESKVDALLMAAERDLTGDAVKAKQIPNKFGIQPGEWRSAL